MKPDQALFDEEVPKMKDSTNGVKDIHFFCIYTI